MKPRSRPRWRSSARAVLLAASLAAPAAAAATLDAPRAGEIFPVFLADPRRVAVSASYARVAGDDASDLGLGHAWGLRRGRWGDAQDWQWEADFAAQSYSRWRETGWNDRLVVLDLDARVPFTARRGPAAFSAEAFFDESHLGDDEIRRGGDTGRRSATEGLRAQASLDARRWLRFYGGASQIVHAVEPLGRGGLQAGFELTGGDFGSKNLPAVPYLAEDLQWRAAVGWNTDSNLVAGVRLGPDAPGARAARVQAAWFAGHSRYGQFFDRREHSLSLALILEL